MVIVCSFVAQALIVCFLQKGEDNSNFVLMGTAVRLIRKYFEGMIFQKNFLDTIEVRYHPKRVKTKPTEECKCLRI